MNKISDCFVGQIQATIRNIQEYIKAHPLAIVGFNAIASSLVNFLDIQSNDNFKFNVDIDRHNSYWYFTICSKYYPAEQLKKVIDKYLNDNKLDDCICFKKTAGEDVYILMINVD